MSATNRLRPKAEGPLSFSFRLFRFRPIADARAVRAVSRKRSSIHEVRLQQKVEKIKYLGSRCHARHAERRVLADTPRFAP